MLRGASRSIEEEERPWETCLPDWEEREFPWAQGQGRRRRGMQDITGPPGKPMEDHGIFWKVVKVPSNEAMQKAWQKCFRLVS